jgi:hypothetical protein
MTLNPQVDPVDAAKDSPFSLTTTLRNGEKARRFCNFMVKYLISSTKNGVKTDLKILKNSLLFSLFSGNLGISVGFAPDDPIDRPYLRALPGYRRVLHNRVRVHASGAASA